MTVETLRLADRLGQCQETSADAYRQHLAEAAAAGWRFAGTHVSADRDQVRTLMVAPGGETRFHSAPINAGTAPSIVDLIPAATWDEREASELQGVCFSGHEPLRPMINHGPLAEWTVPVHGGDVHQVAVGPIHAGIIESGHFRFHLVGDRILHLDARLFYKHRGLERAAEGADLTAASAYIARACAACSVSNGLAYAHAWEQALGLVPSPELARTRTILLELERTWNLLNDLAAVCAGAGMAAGNHHFAALTERARRLNAALTGHRFLTGSVRVGGSDLIADLAAVRAAREEIETLRGAAARGWRAITFNSTFDDRMVSTGVITAEQARRMGTVGPAARAVGIAADARTTDARLAYEGFQPVVVERAAGDVKARVEQRALELWQSLDLLDRLLDRPLVSAEAEPGEGSGGLGGEIGVGIVESPRGATSCVVERASATDNLARVGRVRLRTASFANWPAVVAAATGDVLVDFPLINKSFELCYACVDR
ncbi:MAG: NADH-quinone oxidoreductase subunit C [Micromonosporaceae bacterium]|nr:NADH-quinone oxidoreductase subunit C [Micromonosporaceae bacterium]